MAPTDSKKATVVTREYTINLHKLLHRETFKERAPKAIKAIKKFANDVMKTKDARLDVKLNKAVWSKGVRNIPRRIRVRIQRKRNDDEDAKEELYSYVTVVETDDFSGLGTKVVEDAE